MTGEGGEREREGEGSQELARTPRTRLLHSRLRRTSSVPPGDTHVSPSAARKTPATGPRCRRHRHWLLGQANSLLDFFQDSLNPSGGFHDLDTAGRPMPAGFPAGSRPARQLHATTRMVHCFAIAHLMGRPGADAVIDHGMDFIWNGHRDTAQGGYLWGVGYDGPDRRHQAGLWPRLRAARRVQRQGRRASRRRPAPRRHLRGAR